MSPLAIAVAVGFASPALLAGCGVASGRHDTADAREVSPGVEPALDYEPPAVQGVIYRADLLPVLEAGLGRFLQGVRIEPVLQGGRFVGFRLVELYPSDPRFREIDLVPGDIVVKVNGQSVERPDQAFQIWSGLHVASQLLIEYVRGEARRELRLEIIE